MTKALKITFIWIGLALIFNAGIYLFLGPTKALEFLSGYLVELSLSVDNVFVFLLIFSYFKTTPKDQSKILFWGVLGAQLMRLIFIVLGIALLNKFQWLMYFFGGFLVFTGFKIFFEKGKEINPEKNPFLVLIKKVLPNLSYFWIVLIVVELTDLVFAIDSIPAVLAITKDPFIVYSSNVFAILGLRSMYFALAGVMGLFHYLHYGLGFILIFIGLKMLAEHFIHIPVVITLLVICISLAVTISYSINNPVKKT